MHMSNSGDPNHYHTWRVALAGVILLVILGFGCWMMIEAGETDETQPTGKIVGVVKGQTDTQALAAIEGRVKGQPSKEAQLNALAQEACAIDEEIARRHGNQPVTLEEEPLLERFNDVSAWYLTIGGPSDSLTTRQIKYCEPPGG